MHEMEESECKRFKSNTSETTSALSHSPDTSSSYPRLDEGHEEELTQLFQSTVTVPVSTSPSSFQSPSDLFPGFVGDVVDSSAPSSSAERFITSSFKHPSILRSVSDKLPHSNSHRKIIHRRTSSTQSGASTGCQSSIDESGECHGHEDDVTGKIPLPDEFNHINA